MVYTMALCDGFDHYAPGDALRKWRHVVGSFSTVPGPYHGLAARFAGGGNYFDPGRASGLASRGASVNLRLDSSTWGATARVSPLQLVRRVAGTPDTYTVRQALYVYPDGHLEVRREPSGTVLASSAAGAFAFDAWTSVCYSSSLAVTTAGRCDVYVDGAVVASATGLATCDATPATCTDARLGNCLADGNAVVLDADDYGALHRFDTTGPDPNPPHLSGPHAVATLYPVAPGDAAGFPTVVGAPSGEHWEASAEALGDGDTSYVEKTVGANPSELYRVSPYNMATPELPPSRSSAEGDQIKAVVWTLLAPVAGGNGEACVLLRYRDEDGDWWTDDLGAPFDAAWPSSWRYLPGGVDTSRSGVQTLQVGYGGSTAGDANDQAYRGSQLAVELWYPAPGLAPPPASAAGGTRWSVGWVG